MNIWINIVLGLQMLAALAMIGLILIQHGKGADMGAAFGSGSSGSLFGASGSANFLSRMTAVLATIFFGCTLALTYFGSLHLQGTDASSTLPGFAAPVVVPEVPGTAAPMSEVPGASMSTPAPAPTTAPAPAVTAPATTEAPVAPAVPAAPLVAPATPVMPAASDAAK